MKDVCMIKCMYTLHLNKILSKWQCGFRQGYSTQHCLLIMTEKWRQCLDKGGISGALLTDLSKAFDCLLHDLLIVKLAAYGFDYDSLVLIQSYLFERQTIAALILTYYMVCSTRFYTRSTTFQYLY